MVNICFFLFYLHIFYDISGAKLCKHLSLFLIIIVKLLYYFEIFNKPEKKLS